MNLETLIESLSEPQSGLKELQILAYAVLLGTSAGALMGILVRLAFR